MFYLKLVSLFFFFLFFFNTIKAVFAEFELHKYFLVCKSLVTQVLLGISFKKADGSSVSVRMFDDT